MQLQSFALGLLILIYKVNILLKEEIHLATIKEVASAAGVSIGTVSNVLNGKTNNEEIIQKVEQAIQDLDYRPNAKARSLKSARTYMVGIILDSLNDTATQQILARLEKLLQSNGYSIVIRTTGSNYILEKKNIEYFLQLGVDGIVVLTTMKHRKWQSGSREFGVPILYITGSEINSPGVDSIRLSHTRAVDDFFKWCQEKQIHKAGFILEKSMISISELRQLADRYEIEIHYRLTGDNSRESGYKAAFELLYEEKEIKVMVFGSETLALGAQTVIRQVQPKERLASVCVSADQLPLINENLNAVITMHPREVADFAVNELMQCIQSENYEVHKTVFSNFMEISKYSEYYRITCDIEHIFSDIVKQSTKKTEKSLKIALLDSETAHVLQILAEGYSQQNHISIEFSCFEYHELWNLLCDPDEMKRRDIDIVMYDILWKENLIENETFKNLNFIAELCPEYFKGFIDNMVEYFAIQGSNLYGLPFMTGTQLLFYQKDLFEDQGNKIRFRRMYGRELTVPTTWNEFRQTAEFFTKSFNPESPVKYGTSLIAAGNLYNCIDFLNRMWAEDESGNSSDFLLREQDLSHVLEGYRQCFLYSREGSDLNSWEAVADDFKSGSVAMVILYDSFAFGINDTMSSHVAGNVGSAMIPGGKPALGGWGLALSNAKEKLHPEALSFLLWSCGEEIALPFSLLSGTSSRKAFYEQEDAVELYPWKEHVLESYANSRVRQNTRVEDRLLDNIVLYDQIFGFTLGEYIRGNIQVEDVFDMFETIVHHPDKFEI